MLERNLFYKTLRVHCFNQKSLEMVQIYWVDIKKKKQLWEKSY